MNYLLQQTEDYNAEVQLGSYTLPYSQYLALKETNLFIQSEVGCLVSITGMTPTDAYMAVLKLLVLRMPEVVELQEIAEGLSLEEDSNFHLLLGRDKLDVDFLYPEHFDFVPEDYIDLNLILSLINIEEPETEEEAEEDTLQLYVFFQEIGVRYLLSGGTKEDILSLFPEDYAEDYAEHDNNNIINFGDYK